MNTAIKTPEEALFTALVLSITAPDDAKAKECSDMAESIAASMDSKTIESVKEKVLEILEI